MKADIQSQLAWNNAKILFAECYTLKLAGLTEESMVDLKRRNNYLNHCLESRVKFLYGAEYASIIKFIYGR